MIRPDPEELERPIGRGNGRRGVVPRVTLTCAHCHRAFERKASEVRRRLRVNRAASFFCTTACQRAATHAAALPARSLRCASCGRAFTRDAAQHAARLRAGCTKAYCSPACASTARVARNRQQRPERILLVCAECGRSFERGAPIQRLKQRQTPDAMDFCSRECALVSARLREIWSARRRAFWQDAERRRAASERRVAQMAAGVAPAVSRPEEVVATVLHALAVPFRRQVAVRSRRSGRAIACVDFVLQGGRVLEVFGGFWHCDPRQYPDGPVVAIQRRVRSADARKRRAFARLEIPLAVVWEADIRLDAGAAVRQALASLPEHGASWLWEEAVRAHDAGSTVATPVDEASCAAPTPP